MVHLNTVSIKYNVYCLTHLHQKESLLKSRFAVAFTGPSNSGKTTLITKLADTLLQTKCVAIIKNDPKDKAVFDIGGKDSHTFFQTGAEVVVASPTRTTYFSHQSKPFEEIISMFGAFDIVLVEGLKTIPLPRIAIFRNSIDESYFEYCEAIAIDKTIAVEHYSIPNTIDILDLNNIEEILSWIQIHAKII